MEQRTRDSQEVCLGSAVACAIELATLKDNDHAEVAMDHDLSRRLGRALSDHPVNVAERRIVIEAAEQAETWDALPDSIKALVRDIEARTFPLGLL
jgi:hypothetical protein